MSGAAVVFNPTKIERATLDELLEPARLEAAWGETRWYETTVESPGAEQARQAVAEEATVVIAVGGDGTIRAVAEGLVGSKVALVMLPRGTANLLAKNLRFPINDMTAAVRAAVHGSVRSIDVGRIGWERPDGTSEQHAFLVIAGMGLDAQIMSSTDEALKKRIGMLAYVKVGAKALLKDRRMLMQYRIDDEPPRQTKVHTVLVGNVGTIGPNVTLMPDASVNDGLLDVVAVRPQGAFGWARVAWRVLVDNALLRWLKPRSWRERDDNAMELQYRQCREITLLLKQPEEIQLDGDYFGEVCSLRVTVEPNGLLVKLPLV